jgi:hypothetical protein
MIKPVPKAFWLVLLVGVLAGCIKVELKDERTIPSLYEVALITHTPQKGSSAIPQTLTSSATPVPTQTRTITPTPTLTQTTMPPSPTTDIPSATPSALAAVRFDAWCREGPGLLYPGTLLLRMGEAVTLLGSNADASWLWIQPSTHALQCWSPAAYLTLPSPLPPIPMITPASLPPSTFPLQPTAVPTNRSRPRSPRPTPGDTETPDPYPYPAP